MESVRFSSYDEIAGMYDSLWANWYLPAALPALEKLFFSRVPRGSRVLDLCCGSGHVTKELVTRGYAVTGVDLSAELIRIASAQLPQAEFLVQDACRLNLDRKFAATLSTFDSLNHILSLSDLRDTFIGVRNVLDPGGLFIFDMNVEEAYSIDLQQWAVDISDDAVGLVRGQFNPVTKKARTELVWFVAVGGENLWRQHRSCVEQQCYSESEILLAVTDAGFRSVEAISARDAGVASDLAQGRIFFVATA